MLKKLFSLLFVPFLFFSVLFYGQAKNEVESITEDEGLISNYIFGIVKDQNGFFWTGSDKGLAKYHDGKWHVFDTDSNLPGNYINQICSDYKGGLLLYFSEKGLYYFDTRINKITKKYNYPTKTSAKLYNADINRNYILIAGENSTYYTINRHSINDLQKLNYEKKPDGSIQFFVNQQNRKIVVATDKIFKPKLLHAGNQSYRSVPGLGIQVFEKGSIVDTITENEGLGSNLITSVFQKPSGDIFYSTLGGGISVLRNYNNRKTFSLESSSIRGIQYFNGFYYILADGFLKIVNQKGIIKVLKVENDALSFFVKDDILYTGNFSGINKYSIKNLEIKLLESIKYTSGVSRIFENNGKIYFSTYGGGIQEYPKGVVENKYPFLTIENFFKIKNGYAGISYENGFFLTDNNLKITQHFHKKNSLKSNYVSTVFSDNDTIWVGSRNNITGLVDGKQVVNYDHNNGYIGSVVKNIFRGKGGYIWVVSDKMVMKKTNKKLVPVGSLNFLGSDKNSTISSIYNSEHNTLVMLTKTKFSTVELDKIRPKTNPLAPSLLSITYDGKIVKDWKNIIIPYENKYINFFFDSVDKDLLTSATLFYKINNGNWEKFDQPQMFQLQNLNEGNYQINFKTVNSDGYEKFYSEPINIKVNDVFYKRGWFFLLSLLITFVVTGLIFYEISQNKIKKKYEEIRIQSELESERKRISRDLHDNIGAYTTSLIAKVDNIKPNGDKEVGQLFEIRENAEFIMNLLRQTIWVLGTKASPLSTYIDSFQNYLHKYLIPYPHINYNINEEVEDYNKMFESSKMISVFRIFQEAIQNIVKHSEATTITMNIKSNEKLSLEIIDNGKGFNIEEKHNGYGIKNMKIRAEELDYQFTMESNSTGTRILLKQR